jgi:hypothetical protein
MPSPFPGMNPYLEQEDVWHDFQKRFVARAADAIAGQVIPRYITMVGTHVFDDVHFPRPLYPGLPMFEIRSLEDRKLFTVVVVLGLAYGTTEYNRELYLSKRQQVLAQGANVVEIGLSRGEPALVPPVDSLPSFDYCVTQVRADHPTRIHVWPITLQQPLPKIPIPLKSSESYSILDLQQLVHDVYDAACYGHYVYAGRPDPPLTAEQAEWAREFVPKTS